MLETKLKQEKTEYSEEDYQWLWKSLQRARELYKSYGGKIFAIGRVSGRTEYDSQEGDEVLHWASRFYAPIDRIFVLQQPIDISEFSDFLPVSTRGAITPVVGSDFDRLKKIICAKNEIPDYLKRAERFRCRCKKSTRKTGWMLRRNTAGCLHWKFSSGDFMWTTF